MKSQNWLNTLMRIGKIFLPLFFALTLMSCAVTNLVDGQALPSGSGAEEPKIDHHVWDMIVERHVSEGNDGLNRVDYKGIKDGANKALNMYLAYMSKVEVSTYNRDEQFAFWANVYNALTLKVIVDAYPVDTIKATGGLLSFGPWKAKRFTVQGRELSLDDIEHKILRAEWNDPRVHYAVNCASVGCPNLQNTAFTSENLESLLEKGAVSYINSTRGAVVDNGELNVSSIYTWFKEDFGNTDQGVIAHMKQYAKPALLKQLAQVNSISDNFYDWSLNDYKTAAGAN